MMPSRFALSMLVTLVLIACGGAGFQSYEPVNHKTKVDADQLLTAAQSAIEKRGYRPIKFDRASHTVATREKEVGYSSVPRLLYRYSFKIETGGGVLHIDVDCTANSATSREKFEDCGDERPSRVLDEMEALRDAILEETKTIPKGPVFDEPMDESEEETPEGDTKAGEDEKKEG